MHLCSERTNLLLSWLTLHLNLFGWLVEIKERLVKTSRVKTFNAEFRSLQSNLSHYCHGI